MNLVRCNQFAPLVLASFSGLMKRLFHDSNGTALKEFNPAVDIAEYEKCYEIHVSVSGIKKKDFKIH